MQHRLLCCKIGLIKETRMKEKPLFTVQKILYSDVMRVEYRYRRVTKPVRRSNNSLLRTRFARPVIGGFGCEQNSS